MTRCPHGIVQSAWLFDLFALSDICLIQYCLVAPMTEFFIQHFTRQLKVLSFLRLLQSTWICVGLAPLHGLCSNFSECLLW